MTKKTASMPMVDATALLIPLRHFFHDHGHINVPRSSDYSDLFDLCGRLRTTREKLPKRICDELDSLGFLWHLHLSNELRWYYNYGELKSFSEKFGHTRVPLRKAPYQTLGSWVLRQRRDEKTLQKEQKRLLKSIGFEWSSDIRSKKDIDWKRMFAKLKKFHESTGYSNVPDRYRPDEKLGRWVSTVRYSEERLEKWKLQALRNVKFKFSNDIAKDKEANRKLLFKKIEAFFNKYGHANVPESYKDSKLAIAVAYLRQYPSRINTAEKSQLKRWKFLFSDQIKARWEDLWTTSFNKLYKFKKQFGHCRVSSAYKDRPLARWVANQRKDELEGRLPAIRKQKLLRLGFAFYNDIAAMVERSWRLMYDKLLNFKKKFGTTIVKEGYKDSKLAYWVQHQRQAKSKMSFERKQLLEKIGFTWSVR
ncbi:MAG: helicase associated domain-containing protein [Chryseolinea sp.]